MFTIAFGGRPPLTDHFVVNEMDQLQRKISIATQLTPTKVPSPNEIRPFDVCFICVPLPKTLLGVNDFVLVILELIKRNDII